MKFLADEDVYAVTLHWLRESGHDVFAISESDKRGSNDGEVWETARGEGRILVTRDKGFGRRFMTKAAAPHGVILLRGSYEQMSSVHSTLSEVLRVETELTLAGALCIVQPGRYRIRRPPASPP